MKTQCSQLFWWIVVQLSSHFWAPIMFHWLIHLRHAVVTLVWAGLWLKVKVCHCQSVPLSFERWDSQYHSTSLAPRYSVNLLICSNQNCFLFFFSSWFFFPLQYPRYTVHHVSLHFIFFILRFCCLLLHVHHRQTSILCNCRCYISSPNHMNQNPRH